VGGFVPVKKGQFCGTAGCSPDQFLNGAESPTVLSENLLPLFNLAGFKAVLKPYITFLAWKRKRINTKWFYG
jgi:hypothetical protein